VPKIVISVMECGIWITTIGKKMRKYNTTIIKREMIFKRISLKDQEFIKISMSSKIKKYLLFNN